jgi:hypothetical protein
MNEHWVESDDDILKSGFPNTRKRDLTIDVDHPVPVIWSARRLTSNRFPRRFKNRRGLSVKFITITSVIALLVLTGLTIM